MSRDEPAERGSVNGDPCGSNFNPMHHVLDRLRSGPPVLLDGATGTELARRGFDVSVPGWSAAALVQAPRLVHGIHADYVAAGAEILTANTFRTHARNVSRAGFRRSAAELTTLAVELARAAAAAGVLVAGSQAPLEDCYSPQRTPGEVELRDEHRAHARNLAEAGADLILIETMNTIREAAAAAQAARDTSLPFLVSFVCTNDPQARLLSGEPLADAVRAVVPHGPAAVLVNCVAAPAVAAILKTLRSAAADIPCGAYANTASRESAGRWIETPAADPAAYADHAAGWIAVGAALIGGCCGTTPEHTAQLRVSRFPPGPTPGVP